MTDEQKSILQQLPPEAQFWHELLTDQGESLGASNMFRGWDKGPIAVDPEQLFALFLRWCKLHHITHHSRDIPEFARALKPYLPEGVVEKTSAK